jgi:hypothetical protein
MQIQQQPSPPSLRQQPETRTGLTFLRHLVHWVLGLIGAAALFVAYEHLSLQGARIPAYACLAASALLVLSPVKALLHLLFTVERRVMHVAHAIGGLALVALPVTGMVSGTPVLSHAAMAPFAIMGAAQALMHSNKPRNAAQAEAMRNFVTSMPEVAQFANSRDFSSPANIARAAHVLTDLIGKAQVLGETELEADPGFQSALKRAGVRTGVGLGLDAIQHSIDTMAANPAAAAAVPALRARLAQARRTLMQPHAAAAAENGGTAQSDRK